jgi:hypothetical protein
MTFLSFEGPTENFHNIYIPLNVTISCTWPNQPSTFSPTQRVPVGAYGERQALNIGVSGAGNKPFFKV